MVWVEIPDEVWELYKKGWALFGVKGHSNVVDSMINEMQQRSLNFIIDAKKHLVSDEPEALMLKEIGLREEARRRGLNERDMEIDQILGTLRRSKARLVPLDHFIY